MSETEAEFVEIMMEQGDWGPGSRMHRLALLARRGAEAAGEIERLSEVNEMMLTDIRRTDVDMLAFKAEIERLRADLDAADLAVSRLNGRAELQMLMRENNKLRACLVDIATGQVVELPFIQELARAALSPTASPEIK